MILDSYAEFDQIDQDDNVRLMGITARGANRDGCAVRFICESLLKRPEADKLFFILSDGQPSAWDYSGEAAESDLKSIKRESVRKGIVFVAAAIGDDKENIERIDGNSFIDVSNLEKLPEILTNFIKRQLSI